MISIASLAIKKRFNTIVYSIQLKLNGFEFKVNCYWKIHIFIKLLSNFLSLRKMRSFFSVPTCAGRLDRKPRIECSIVCALIE